MLKDLMKKSKLSWSFILCQRQKGRYSLSISIKGKVKSGFSSDISLKLGVLATLFDKSYT